MNDCGTVSVVVPVCNDASFMTETLRSILGRTRPRLEVLVVDDGSKDDSAEIVRQIAGVTLIVKQNCGAATARNMGAAPAGSQWLKRMLGLG